MNDVKRSRRTRMVRLHERDRELLGHLAVVRYLSTEQIAQLMFPGRHSTRAKQRLRELSGGEHNIGYVRRLTWRTFDGRPQAAWTLDEAGYLVAEQVVGPVRVPARDVSPAFMAHTLALNELYVRLLTAGVPSQPGPRGAKGEGLSPLARMGTFARACDSRLRWVASDAAELPWTEYDQRAGKESERVIRPDAVLELPSKTRRLFIECEMGTHPIAARQDDRAGATLNKVARYVAFVNRLADAAGRRSFYAQRYPDRWRPELVFLVRTDHRAESVKGAIGAWRKSNELGLLQLRVDVIESLSASLVAEIGSAPAMPARPDAVRGKVTPSLHLSGEDFERFTAFCTGAVAAMKAVRDAARARSEAPPAYPPHANWVLQLLQRLKEQPC